MISKRNTIIVLIVLFGVADVFLFARLQRKPAPAAAPVPPAAPAVAKISSAINGVSVDLAVAAARPIGVMVENYPAARPQSGLVDADVVYEAPTEGGITRFLALYQTTSAKNIGPIRSARTYFVDFANEWGAVYAHVGGNSDALANIRTNDYPNISDADQFFNDPYFQRVSWRTMPHNVYTSIDKLQALIGAHQFSDSAAYQPWQFKDDTPSPLIPPPGGEGGNIDASTTAADININFFTKDYAVEWKYSVADNSYARFLAGKAHKDLDSGKQITAKNFVVQLVKTFPVKSDTPLSIGMDLSSGGPANIFLDSRAIIGTWKKTDGRTRYYDSSGNEISFNRGSIWVELVPDDGLDRVSWQ